MPWEFTYIKINAKFKICYVTGPKTGDNCKIYEVCGIVSLVFLPVPMYAKFRWLISHVQFSFHPLSVTALPRLTDNRAGADV